LANRGFSLYTYQLISEKLVEDDESAGHDKKLEACKLLVRAIKLCLVKNFTLEPSMPKIRTIIARAVIE
jgi:hypothetical protein